MSKIALDFNTEHHQFFLKDKGYLVKDSENLWNDKAHKDRLAVRSGFLSIGTSCYGALKGEIVLLNEKNKSADFARYDHVVEASIFCKSGTLEIIPCMSNVPEVSVNVSQGSYRVRVYSSGLNSVLEDEGDDFYRIEIWEEPFAEHKVLKYL